MKPRKARVPKILTQIDPCIHKEPRTGIRITIKVYQGHQYPLFIFSHHIFCLFFVVIIFIDILSPIESSLGGTQWTDVYIRIKRACKVLNQTDVYVHVVILICLSSLSLAMTDNNLSIYHHSTILCNLSLLNIYGTLKQLSQRVTIMVIVLFIGMMSNNILLTH